MGKLASPAVPVAFFAIASSLTTFVGPADSSLSSLWGTYAPLVFVGVQYLLGVPLDLFHLYATVLNDSQIVDFANSEIV